MTVISLFFYFVEKKDKKLGETFTFEDMFNSEFVPKTFDGKWLKGMLILFS